MYDSKYDSKMHDITIPLMGFNGFHHASSTDSKEEFEDFIGRDSIIDKLKGWLYDAREDNRRHTSKYSGAYLITGFRGMGKSSFVHKTIQEIKTQKITKKKYIPISINVGNDLLTSRELLYIICKLLDTSFRENTRIETKLNLKYFFRQSKHFFYRVFRFIKNIFTLNLKEIRHSIEYVFCSNFILITLLVLLCTSFHLFNSDVSHTSIIQGLEKILTSLVSFFSYIYHFIVYKWLGYNKSITAYSNLDLIKLGIDYKDILIVILLTMCLFIRQIFYILYKMTNSSIFITKYQILCNFKHILQRIESEMTIVSQKGIETKVESDGVKSGYHFSKNKNNHYPFAQTTEIQDLLVSQLSLINKLPSANLRFIFIIDELDKVSPEDVETQVIPEYEYTTSVKGNSTYRSRQKALAELLANLKYFISSSEAKFVFITGYDMYESTLSDISNREFNIHSIFNGYINVSSFMRKTGKSKGADSMIEEYFTHLLLKKDVKAKKKKMVNLDETVENEKQDKRRDLHDYSDHFRSIWKENPQKISNQELAEYEILLERRINFLRHFLTYLFYMSNGSPKKLAMYLEKYIRSKKRVIEQIETKHYGNFDQEIKHIKLGAVDYWDKCDWFLYFDARNIQKIEFINYLIYPMIKNLIAKSSIYNDKLLVATSFMISNLYKFHKSGFSWRNLEYMPELLEINKMPELRDFIGGIMQFLNQTHIDEATINLYKFKFPLRLSEEITYYSKSSEEISYLFNFSHDELLSIKKLYLLQLKHYSTMKNESPAIASIHHTLGDIYMLEENFEQAIYEFNEALNAISRQDMFLPDHKDDTSNFLFKLRVSLKLGLAYEKRKTFDTAYITYHGIVEHILKRAANAVQGGKPRFFVSFCNSDIDSLDNNSTFFGNIRISYLAILAKAAVLEKMDLGGIRKEDLNELYLEFSKIVDFISDEMRPVVQIDFFKKLGDILYYKNGIFAQGNDQGKSFTDFVKDFRKLIKLDKRLTDKFDICTKFMSEVDDTDKRTVNPPCIACQCFNISILNCINELNGKPDSYVAESRSIFFIELLFSNKGSQDVLKKGNVFMLSMANLLVGMGNTLLGCIKNYSNDITVQQFFSILKEFLHDGFSHVSFQAIQSIKSKNILNPYSKSILYYLAAAKTYELLTDFKSAYNIYNQILDAIFAYSQAVSTDIIDRCSLRFCEIITEQAITCVYLHYDSINCEEIDTEKHELAKRRIENINLHSLSSFPEIEVVTEKYYHLCLLGKTEKRDRALKSALNSRQLGQYRLIATLTQNIQNLYFKVTVNEEILSWLIPDMTKSFADYKHSLILNLVYIKDYYDNYDIKGLIDHLEWHIIVGDQPTKDDKIEILNYLINDTLFCLNKITELIAPLFSTTLYSNAYIGLIFEKVFNWSQLWISMREMFEYVRSKDKDKYLSHFIERYPLLNDDYYRRLRSLLSAFEGLQVSKTQESNAVFYSEDLKFYTGSYLTGSAIDFFNRAVEMHTSGKTYKEMMPTLFFLEDDLNNDSNYLNLAIERFLLNHDFVQKKIDSLKKISFAKSSLLRIDNYYKP